MEVESAPKSDSVISLSGITKRFPGVLANDQISLDFQPGEIHALLGENGAGKSTLIGILSGMQQPDSGSIRIKGTQVRINSPKSALTLGIGTVYQHVLLIPSLTVLENLMLGAPWWRACDNAGTKKRFEELCALLATELDPDVPVGRLSLGQQQQVEIIRALWHGQLALILDEPTSMLTPQGVRELGGVIRRLRDHGVAIIFITHKLKEAYELSDRVSVLRLGKVVGQLTPEQLGQMSEHEVTDAVIGMMFGLESAEPDLEETLVGDSSLSHDIVQKCHDGSPLLQLQSGSTNGKIGECPLIGADLSIWPGEVMGIAGVDGNGQKHLAEVLAGQRPLAGGSLVLDGQEIGKTDLIERRKLGVRYITDERLGEGTANNHSVATNLVLKEIGQSPFWKWGLTQNAVIRRFADEKIMEHDIRTPSAQTPIGRLSGGNIQKVLLAREEAPDAKLVIFNKPTYGLDLQNTIRAREWIRQGAGAHSAALVVISNELEELREVSHRIAVMSQGRIVGVVENNPTADTEIGRLMTGMDAA
ncbi:MAG: ABC transporter ATP-binding protein [Pseudomonadota bacterium]